MYARDPVYDRKAESGAARAAARLFQSRKRLFQTLSFVLGDSGAAIALIDDPALVRRILEHLGLWVDEVPETQGLPPVEVQVHTNLPLTYHPVPDIA